MRYATVTAWAKYLEEHEGVKISDTAIYSKLKRAGKKARTFRSKLGSVLKRAFYSETDIREACAGTLRNVPYAGNHNFLTIEGVKYGSIGYWSKKFLIPRGSLKKRLKKNRVEGIDGRGKTGIHTFYSEADIRTICNDYFQHLPEADKLGFFEKDGVKYGTYKAWAESLSLSAVTLIKRIRKSKVKGIKGKIKEGNVCIFYTKCTIVELCKDLLDDAPRADKSGFLIIEGIKYGSIKAWARSLGISATQISRMLKKIMTISIVGRINEGNKCDFYSQPDVYRACKELLDDYPQADKDGFFIKNNKKYATALRWSKFLNIRYESLLKKLQRGADSVKGKLKGGQIKDFYSELDTLSACADLLAKRQQK